MTAESLTAHETPLQPALSVPPRGMAAHGRGVQVAAATLFSAAAIFGPVALTFRGIRKGPRR